MFMWAKGKTFTLDDLMLFINKKQKERLRYERLQDMYLGKHQIFRQAPKEGRKPDNRIVANFAKYIVDTFGGFFIGEPVRLHHPEAAVAEYIEQVTQYNNLDDLDAEKAKSCDIVGYGYELLYLDEMGYLRIVNIPADQAFLIYDDSITRNVLYGVRFFRNFEGQLEGSFSDNRKIYYFSEGDSGLVITDEKLHGFDGVPLIEYIENEERQGLFEQVTTLIDAYNKAVSEKANDVDYYADAILCIIGADLEDGLSAQKQRDSRLLVIKDGKKNEVDVSFLAKPEADETQENLLTRLERHIYTMSMVANITDEQFKETSGIALKYKLQPMSNLAKTKERKFTAAMQKRWRLIASHPATPLAADDWLKISYRFTQNLPANLAEEAEIAGKLAGVVSQDTQLKVLSIVDNVTDEKERLQNDRDDGGSLFSKSYSGGN